VYGEGLAVSDQDAGGERGRKGASAGADNKAGGAERDGRAGDGGCGAAEGEDRAGDGDGGRVSGVGLGAEDEGRG